VDAAECARWHTSFCLTQMSDTIALVGEFEYELQWTQSTRRHRIGRAHARFVVEANEPTTATRPTGELEFTWTGADDRGVDLHIVGVLISESIILIIHVSPIYRFGERRQGGTS